MKLATIAATQGTLRSCIAGAINALDPQTNVICLLVADVQREAAAAGESTEFSGNGGPRAGAFDIAYN